MKIELDTGVLAEKMRDSVTEAVAESMNDWSLKKALAEEINGSTFYDVLRGQVRITLEANMGVLVADASQRLVPLLQELLAEHFVRASALMLFGLGHGPDKYSEREVQAYQEIENKLRGLEVKE